MYRCPIPVFSARRALEEEDCTSLAHLLSKATKQNLSLCTRFHLKKKPSPPGTQICQHILPGRWPVPLPCVPLGIKAAPPASGCETAHRGDTDAGLYCPALGGSSLSSRQHEGQEDSGAFRSEPGRI